MQSHAPILYQELLVSSWYRKVGTIAVGFICASIILSMALGISSTIFYTESYTQDRWMILVIAAFVSLGFVYLGSYVKGVLVHGRIILTSQELTLTHGSQEISFPKADIVQYAQKLLYPGSRRAPSHVLREDGDMRKGFIACQVFPAVFPETMKLFWPEGLFLVTKRTTPSSGGLFGRRILADLPFFIPTSHPDRLLAALEKIAPLREGGFKV